MDVAGAPKTFPIVVAGSRGQSLEEVSVLSLTDLTGRFPTGAEIKAWFPHCRCSAHLRRMQQALHPPPSGVSKRWIDNWSTSE